MIKIMFNAPLEQKYFIMLQNKYKNIVKEINSINIKLLMPKSFNAIA
jgi:hypothetical protein